MDTTKKFMLPSPCFNPKKDNSCLAVPQGDLLPKGPPMYGPRGTTIPPRFLERKYQNGNQQHPFQKHRGRIQRFQNHNQPKQNVPVPNFQHNLTQQFWCETCDRPFSTLAKLETHKFEHQICGIDDCMFIGHPSVVAKHIEAQHTSGLYKKIKNLSTPEEITKWREERKKRYPTRANVELRQKAQAERMKRGEKLTEKKSRFGQQTDRRQMGKMTKEDFKKGFNLRGVKDKTESNDHNSQQGNNKRNRRRKKPSNEKRNNKCEKSFEDSNANEQNFNGKLKMFKGTLSMSDYHSEKQHKIETNALTSLLDMYASSSENDINDDEHENILNQKEKEDCLENIINDKGIACMRESRIEECNNKNNYIDIDNKTNFTENLPLNITTKICSNSEENNDNDLPDEKPIGRELENETLLANLLTSNTESSIEAPPNKRIRSNNQEKNKNPRKYSNNNLLDYSKLRKRPQNTMLEKLLESDIRHERNVLLQCVRHVVKNNFFGIGKKKV